MKSDRSGGKTVSDVVEAEAGGRRPVRLEPIGGRPLLVDGGMGDERWIVGRSDEPEIDAFVGEARPEHPAVLVGRDPAEERRRPVQSCHGPGNVVRAAAKGRPDPTVASHDAIHQALSGDNDHRAILATRRPAGRLLGTLGPMDRLTGVAELLDGPLDDEAALVANLLDLARINRLTGGTRLSERAIEALGPTTTILDVGTGAADIPMRLLARAAAHGQPLSITAIDSRPEVLAAAVAARPAIEHVAGLVLAIADGRGLPYPDDAFDVAHASLVLHHLEPNEVIAFLVELRRVARNGVVINDLIRSRPNWIGAWLLLHAIARGRYTRHDGPLSVRRAYTRDELAGLIADAGLTPVAAVVGLVGHRVAIAAR